ncbi:hypothetical protein HK099_002081, partial [Clydaea vesicula]
MDERYGFKKHKSAAERRKFVASPQINTVASSRYPTSEHLRNLERLTGYDPVFRSGVLRGRPDVAQWLIDNNVCLFHRILLSDCDAAGLSHSRYDFINATASNLSSFQGTIESSKNLDSLVSSSINKVVPSPLNKTFSSGVPFTFQNDDYGNYSLNPDIFNSLLTEFNFQPKVDLFADPCNKKVFHFYSRIQTSLCHESNGRKLELHSICKPFLLPDSHILWKPKFLNKSHTKPPWRVAAYLIQGKRNHFGTSFTQYKELLFPKVNTITNLPHVPAPFTTIPAIPNLPEKSSTSSISAQNTATAKKPNTTLGEEDSIIKLSSPKRDDKIKTFPLLKSFVLKDSYSTAVAKFKPSLQTPEAVSINRSKAAVSSLAAPATKTSKSVKIIPLGCPLRTAKKLNTTLGGEDSLKKLSPPKREKPITVLSKLKSNLKKFFLADSSLPVIITNSPAKRIHTSQPAKPFSTTFSSKFPTKVVLPDSSLTVTFRPMQTATLLSVTAKKTFTTLGGEDSLNELSPPKRDDKSSSFRKLNKINPSLAIPTPKASLQLLDTTSLDTFGQPKDKFLFPGKIYVKTKKNFIPIHVHVDSGASVLTISTSLVKKYNLPTFTGITQQVEFANKTVILSNVYCKVKLHIQDFHSTFTAAVLPINDDLILGVTFFKAVKVIDLDWQNHSFTFITSTGDKHTW